MSAASPSSPCLPGSWKTAIVKNPRAPQTRAASCSAIRARFFGIANRLLPAIQHHVPTQPVHARHSYSVKPRPPGPASHFLARSIKRSKAERSRQGQPRSSMAPAPSGSFAKSPRWPASASRSWLVLLGGERRYSSQVRHGAFHSVNAVLLPWPISVVPAKRRVVRPFLLAFVQPPLRVFHVAGADRQVARPSHTRSSSGASFAASSSKVRTTSIAATPVLSSTCCSKR